ncbi:MAG: hypothetical protein IPK94_22600 [Saprospiraceae bacterium]|nr:hypothetical protein [Saprospiraceae bacterium]
MKNKDQYQLETSIIRCYFVKIPDDIKELRNVREWWDGINDDANRKKTSPYEREIRRYLSPGR